MAIHTLRSVRPGLMVMMSRGIEAAGFVALGTERIALCYQLAGMGVVTITAGHAFLLHFALQKRTHDKNFVVNLAIGKIKPLVEQCQAVLVVKSCQWRGISYRRTSRMTSTTGIDVILIFAAGRRGDIILSTKRPGKSRRSLHGKTRLTRA